MLLYARCGPSGSPLVNGATGTVTAVEEAGLIVRLDGSGEAMSLPAAFVQGARKDGSPNLSHAWARTVDGAQGGTWEACHLLGSAALDAYRGYTGQSRSRQPTHTWNTARVAVVDHGGVFAAEGELRKHFASLAQHQQDRQQALAAADPGRKQFEATLAQFDAALDHTRADRVQALTDDPPAYLVERLGRAPGSPAGRAVWCHHVAGIEAVLDRNDGNSPLPTGGGPWDEPQEVAIADRLLRSSADPANPTGWAELAGQAAALRKQAQRLMMARATIGPAAGTSATSAAQSRHGRRRTQQGPELSL